MGGHHRLTWCFAGLNRKKYGSEERKRTKVEKVLLMMVLRNLMTNEEATMACAERSNFLCLIRFMLEQMSSSAVSTCAKILEDGCEPKRPLQLKALADIHQSKPLRVNIKEPEDLDPLRKIDEIRRLSTKSLGSPKNLWKHMLDLVNTVDLSERSRTTMCRE